VGDQCARGRGYRRVVEGALRHPLFVGSHWFQYRDQPLVGRGDGENYQIGFVDVCDRPYAQLAEAGNRASRKVATAGVRAGFGPVMDGTIVAEHPFDPEATSISKDIPMLIGTDFNEFTFDISEEKTEAEVKAALVERMGEEKAVKYMEEFKKAFPEEPAKAMLYMDVRFRSGAVQQAAAKSRQNGAKPYLYQFTWKPENNVLGASHGMELPFMFNNVAVQREMTGSSESAYKLQEIISNYWLAFIKTGDPNVAGQPVWEPYNEETGPCMMLHNTCVMKYNHDKALLELAQ
jgi:para-nitrobenzyl esterase